MRRRSILLYSLLMLCTAIPLFASQEGALITPLEKSEVMEPEWGWFSGSMLGIQGYHPEGSGFPISAHLTYGWYIGLETSPFTSGPTVGCEFQVPIAPLVTDTIWEESSLRIVSSTPIARIRPDGALGTISHRSVVYVPTIQAGVVIPFSGVRPVVFDLQGTWLKVDFGDLAVSIGDVSLQFIRQGDSAPWFQYAGWGFSPLRIIYRNW